MIEFKNVKPEDVKEWLPETYNAFIEELRSSKSPSSKKREDKIIWNVSYIYATKKAKTEEEKIQREQDTENKMHLTFDERFKQDTPKISVYVYMKAGYYERYDKSIDEVPKKIIELSETCLKQTMLKEQLYVKDQVVLNSLSEFKHLLRGIVELDENDDPIFNAQGKPIPYMPFEVDEDGLPKIDPETGKPIMKSQKKSEPKQKMLSMDELLDKINDEGMSSLSPAELEFLDKMSRS